MSSKNYINREVSWLSFNERVLQEAMDISNPVLERMKYLGIFSNNRDEFYRVRVATLNRMKAYKKIDAGQKREITRTLRDIHQIVADQEANFTQAYHNILDELAKNNIFIINENELDIEQQQYVEQYFQQNIRLHLSPLLLDSISSLAHFKDKHIYLAVKMADSKKSQKDNFALIELPTEEISRFIKLPQTDEKNNIIFLDDVIRVNLKSIFGIFGYDTFEGHIIKFTRDAELDIDSDLSKSFLETMNESIKQRIKGDAVRFVYDSAIDPRFLKKLLAKFGITHSDTLRAGGRYHNFKDFMDFPIPINIETLGKDKTFLYNELHQLSHPYILPSKSMFELIREKDIMFHYPYHTFQHIVNLVREAAIDPKVRSIKMTFYRVAKKSKIINALINAARNGKLVTVFLELQARFDEQANIMWTQKLQEEGVRVIQNIPGFKVHSKLLLIRRKEKGKSVHYANISTGNFNESTAKVYADDSLLTSDKTICDDVNNVFHLFESKYLTPSFSELVVSPFKLRNFFTQMINREIRNARAGKEAWVILKLNNLVDTKIVNKLYLAGKAGVKITLIIRGICVLKAGEAGLSENIEAFGIVDRFLEHSRVFVFANEDNPEVFLTSADLMSRNLDHRIEVVCPIKSSELKLELIDMLQIQIKDNVKSRWLHADKINKYRLPKAGEKLVRSQEEIYSYLKSK
ncbi:MAG: polyphosphate kinase 1 [Bacteroidales bacterium]|jgi:polyphosphate kinase|nr:polyphosphate kinase 1 [Bacteroidales bacterium]